MTATIKLADPGLLTKIDKLFACGVGDHVALPQLVVVGDQSSGKSSVLEGLTKIPFPRDSTLCTRFATQITFRRNSETKVTYSIVPDAHCTDASEIERLKGWRQTDTEAMTASTFAERMKEVFQVLQLGGKAQGFSEHVFRIEISGPEQEHFSIVDVPGIFRKSTQGQTTSADIALVRDMVESYMANPRSVLLAVVPANVDVATQDILTMAEKHDPEGQRTIGVLTKPDLVDAGSESAVMDLLNGKAHQLNHGWCAVRNRGQKDLSDPSVDRDEAERSFFKRASPWNTLPEDRTGIVNLRLRLQKILSRHISREFPKVKAEVRRMLTSLERELADLGASRQTDAEQRQFLLRLSSQFQSIVDAALRKNYASSPLFDSHAFLRLPTKIVARNEAFADTMARHGHLWFVGSGKVASSASVPNGDGAGSAGNDDEEDEHHEDEQHLDSKTDAQAKIQVRKVEDVREAAASAEVSDLLIDEDEAIDGTVQTGDAVTWLKDLYLSSRGFELGTFDEALLSAAMKEQTKKWEALALGYISDVILLTDAFIRTVVISICPDHSMRSILLDRLLPDLVTAYRRSRDHVVFLLQVERKGVPTTLNHYFNANLEKMRQKRLHAALSAFSHPFKDSTSRYVPLDKITAAVHNMSNADHVVRELHDILDSYYKVARKRFVDSVCMQGAGYYLINDTEISPLKLFSPNWVAALSTEELEEIAGEEPGLKHRRMQLQTAIERLSEGVRILR